VRARTQEAGKRPDCAGSALNFFTAYSGISDFPIPAQTGIFGLMDKKAVSELNRFTEKNRFFPALEHG